MRKQSRRSVCWKLSLALVLVVGPMVACNDSSSGRHDAGAGGALGTQDAAAGGMAGATGARDGAAGDMAGTGPASGGATGRSDAGGTSGLGGGTSGGQRTGGSGTGGGGTGGRGGTGTGGTGTAGRGGSGGKGGAGGTVGGVDAGIDTPTGTSDGSVASSDGGVAFNAGYNLGINLDGIAYWSSYAPYVDMARGLCGNDEATCWDSLEGNPGVPIDSHGYPTVAAGASVWAPYPSGTYQVTWEGTGTLEIALDQGSFSQTGANAGTLAFVKGAHLQVNVVKPPVTNIRIMAPQGEYEPGHKFRRTFLQQLQPFSTLRTMDMTKTNSNTVKKWSERSWPEDHSSGKAHGVPYEELVTLANESGKDLWINVPTLATDDYVCRMARLFRYGEHGDRSDAACDPAAPGNPPADAVALDPGRTLYVEFGNELWNWGFDAPHAIFCMVWGQGDGAYKNPPEDASCPWGVNAPSSAIGIAALKDSKLPWSTDNVWGKGSQFAAVLTRRVSTIFKTVFKGAPAQVKIVLGVQSAYPTGDAETELSFLAQAYGDVKQIVDALAVAPYLDILDVEGNPVAITGSTRAAQLNSIFATLDSSLTNTVGAWLANDKKLADQYRLPLISYEGGQGLAGSQNQEAKIAAQDDPRMFDLTRKYLKLWHDTVGANALFTYYSFATDRAEWGSWGALTDGDQAGSQKWDALMSLLCPVGDANRDGHVDSADLAIIQSNLGKSGMWWSQGDFNHDGQVNQTDLDLAQQNLGR